MFCWEGLLYAWRLPPVSLKRQTADTQPTQRVIAVGRHEMINLVDNFVAYIACKYIATTSANPCPMNLKQIKNVPGARKIAMPEFVSPQLATLVKEPPKGDEWLHELKFDGYRLLCFLNRGQVRLWTRHQKDWTDKFPNVAKALKSLKVQSAILDAEVVALDSSGRSSFQMLQQAIHKTGGRGLVLEVFDVIYLEGFSLTKTAARGTEASAGRVDSDDERSRVALQRSRRGPRGEVSQTGV